MALSYALTQALLDGMELQDEDTGEMKSLLGMIRAELRIAADETDVMAVNR